jgi:hypothetical protein
MRRILLGDLRDMSNQQSNPSAMPVGNQQRQQQQAIVDEHIKQMIMDALIELNIVPRPKRKKVLSDV